MDFSLGDLMASSAKKDSKTISLDFEEPKEAKNELTVQNSEVVLAAEKSLVVKSNRLVEAIYKNLTLNEHRMITLAIVNLRQLVHENPNQGMIPPSIFISKHQYQAFFGVTSHSAYKILKEAATSLYEKTIKFSDAEKSSEIRWIYKKSIYNVKNSGVEISFSPEIIAEILDVTSDYTKYFFRYHRPLPTFYSIRLYELLSRWRYRGETDFIEINYFRELLGVEEEAYTRVQHLKERVIFPAMENIHKFTDLKITNLVNQKAGRTIIGFKFYFEINNEVAYGLEPIIDISQLSELEQKSRAIIHKAQTGLVDVKESPKKLTQDDFVFPEKWLITDKRVFVQLKNESPDSEITVEDIENYKRKNPDEKQSNAFIAMKLFGHTP